MQDLFVCGSMVYQVISIMGLCVFSKRKYSLISMLNLPSCSIWMENTLDENRIFIFCIFIQYKKQTQMIYSMSKINIYA